MTIVRRYRTVTLIIVIAIMAAAAVEPRLACQAGDADVILGKALHLEEVDGKLQEAIAAYKGVLSAPGATRAQKARAQFRIAACYERLGRREARLAYETVVRDYGDQRDLVAQARARLSALGGAARPQSGGGVTERLLWSDPTSNLYWKISPSGETVAYTIGFEDSNLWMRDVSGGEPRRLTNAPKPGEPGYGYTFNPTWSHDGKRLAYQWMADAPATTSCELRVVEVSTARVTPIPNTLNTRCPAPLDWSSDGSRLLVRVTKTVAGHPVEDGPMAWVSLNDGTLREFFKPDHTWRSAKVSPDGSFVAYTADLGGPNTDVYITSAGGGQATAVVNWAGRESVVGWMGDGRLLFAGSRGGQRGLWAVRMAGGAPQGEPTPLRQIRDNVRLESASRSGRVLYTAAAQDARALMISTKQPGSDTWSPGAPLDVAGGAVEIYGPLSWSPDGSRLLYVVTNNAAPSLAVSSLDGRAFRLIASEFAPAQGWGGPTWTPDGRHVLVAGRVAAGDAFYRVDVDSGGTTQVTLPRPPRPAGEDPHILIAMSPDERTFYKQINHRGSQLVSVRKVDAKSGEETELFRSEFPAGMFVGALSADGQWLPAVLNPFPKPDRPSPDQTVMLIPVAGGAPRVLCTTPGRSAMHKFTWSAGGRSVFFRHATGFQETRHSELWECPVEGGPARSLGISMPVIESIAAHPDGRRLAFAGSTAGRREVWLLEHR